MNNKEAVGLAAATALVLTAGATYLYNSSPNNNDNNIIMKGKAHGDDIPKVFQDETLGPKVKAIIGKYAEKFTSDEAVIKIVRQLDFWHSEGLSEAEMLEMTESLAEKATILNSGFKCPQKRFGKTELQIPIVTCGGMRLQQTWMVDFMPWPLTPRKSQVLTSPSQENLMNAVRLCLKMGINHFETARYYGTSEYQFAEALYTLIQNGEIKREDFIFQTKIPPYATRTEFEKMFENSWAHCKKLGYIDLLSIWCVSNKEQTEMVLDDGEDSCMAAALEYKKQGKVKHIGFSTHGPAVHILEIINSEKMEYVNIHCHYLSSYHAQGTPDGQGGHGNMLAVKRALELDMGVFLISPLDKGGMVYKPSKTLATTLGPKMTPIEFAMLTGWESGHHTSSVGFARPADIEDSMVAARMYTQAGCDNDLRGAMERMGAQMEKELGKEWKEKGLLNIPTCENESTDGTAIGHILGLYNLMKALGMYDFCAARYSSLSGCPWNKNKSFEENRKKMPGGNMGRAYIPGTDYSKALESHYDTKSAVSNMEQLHEWMQVAENDKETRKEMGFEDAYDLRVWEEFPGRAPTAKGVVLQNITFGLFGSGGGPTKSFMDLAAKLVDELKD